MNVLSAVHFTIRKKLLFAAGLALMLGVSGLVGVRAIHVAAADCDQNAIIYCGTGSASQFIAQVRKNDSKNGHHDLQTVYAHYGLESTDYDKFVSYSRPGTAYKDGRIVVDGKVVATDAESIGRLSKSYSHPKVIGGVTYYESRAQDVFKSDSIPVMAMFNSKGVLQFAVLTSCGNPIIGPRVTPTYSCNLLRHAPLAGHPNTYTFNTSAAAGNNASIAKLVYDFGDGSPTKTTTDINTSVAHTYTRAGTFTAKVTVYVNLPGNQQVAVSSGDCTWQVKVVLPYYQCLQLAGTIDRNNKYKYNFTAKAKYGNGASFSYADFNFGDGHSASGVKPQGVSVSASHTYAKGGTYDVTARLYFDANGKKVSAGTCKTQVTVITPIYQCVQLAGSILDQDKHSYRFVATARFGNGAQPTGADFNFGDGSVATGVKPNGSTFTVDHTYVKAGNYDSSATLHFTVNGKSVSAPTCKAKVTPTTAPTPECKPGVAVGSPLCTPCQYDTTLPSNSPECIPPELPNTGAGNTIALFAVAVVGGFLVYRQLIFRQHKAAFLAAEQGTSPTLDPLAPTSDAPDARVGHPYRSLRRRRPF
jgi:hypothetical protein